MLVDYGGVLALVPAMKRPVQQAYGLLAGKRSLSEALRRERGQED
jgi:hypothetical protein